jgi:DNA-binding MarR family transcriptional regulator
MTTDLSIIGRALKQAQYRHHLALDRALAEVQTTVVQWDALRAIEESPGSSAHDLAVATFQSDQAFGTLATRLEKQGLIERVAGAGRRIEHRLTSAGKHVLDAANRVAAQLLARSFAPLDANERETLFSLLQRVGRDQPR